MLNPKWYLVCDIATKSAVDLIQIPAVWGQTTGLLEQSDESLEEYWTWAHNSTTAFLTQERVGEFGIDEASVTSVLTTCKPIVLDWVRQMRDRLLAASDAVTVPDRWHGFDVVAQNNISIYRQALRDLTTQDPFHLTWPAIPPELDFLRGVSIADIERPDAGFIASLQNPFPELTLQQKRDNQWLRIKALRDLREISGVSLTIDGSIYWFWTDASNLNKYSILLNTAIRKALPDDHVFDQWKTMGGQFVPMTVATLYNLIDVGSVYIGEVFQVAEMHREYVMESDDPDNYNYQSGWPQTYSDYLATL